MIRTRNEILGEIKNSPKLERCFYSWTTAEQNQFLDFCTGQKGVKILYDSFFKEILNPEYNPARLEKLLSVFLKQKVKIVFILPNDTVRLSDEMTLLITDIIVQLKDGSLVNLEVQKIGYTFPGSVQPAMVRTLCFVSTRESGMKKGKISLTVISKRYI